MRNHPPCREQSSAVGRSSRSLARCAGRCVFPGGTEAVDLGPSESQCGRGRRSTTARRLCFARALVNTEAWAGSVPAEGDKRPARSHVYIIAPVRETQVGGAGGTRGTFRGVRTAVLRRRTEGGREEVPRSASHPGRGKTRCSAMIVKLGEKRGGRGYLCRRPGLASPSRRRVCIRRNAWAVRRAGGGSGASTGGINPLINVPLSKGEGREEGILGSPLFVLCLPTHRRCVLPLLTAGDALGRPRGPDGRTVSQPVSR